MEKISWTEILCRPKKNTIDQIPQFKRDSPTRNSIPPVPPQKQTIHPQNCQPCVIRLILITHLQTFLSGSNAYFFQMVGDQVVEEQYKGPNDIKWY
jgi:hypothetical protein